MRCVYRVNHTAIIEMKIKCRLSNKNSDSLDSFFSDGK